MVRLKKLGVDCKVYLLKDYPHGFGNMDLKKIGVAEVNNAT